MTQKNHMTRSLREVVMCSLYQLEHVSVQDLSSSSETFLEIISEKNFNKDIIKNGQMITKEIWSLKSEIDPLIETLTPEWPISRQPIIDRNILRLAIWENTVNHSPRVVIINEAIELAKKYSTKDSSNFINGVLEKAIPCIN